MDQISDGSGEEDDDEEEEEEETSIGSDESSSSGGRSDGSDSSLSSSSSSSEGGGRSDGSDEPPPKRRRKSETLDRISELPESIILHILSLLPMDEVVRTSSLSKKWQYLWTTVPNLIFTNHKSPNNVSDFVRFVDQTLIQCRHSKIHKFIINFHYTSDFTSHVNLWIRFAASCNVEDLSIDLEAVGNYTLPEHTFSCSSIINLKLVYCNVLPKGVITWKSLKNLSLCNLDVSEDTIHNILLGSPLLDIFELNYCRGFNRLDISSTSLRKLVINGYWCYSQDDHESILEILAPNLQSLEILGALKQKRCRLVNMLSLVDANLSFYCTTSGQDSKEYRNMVTELLQSLNHVKELTLGFMCIRVISRLKLKHWPSLSKLKWLRLNTFFLNTEFSGIEALLQSSLDLETLIIDMPSSSGLWIFGASAVNSYNSEKYLTYDLEKYLTSRKRIIFPCLQRHLKIVKFVGFSGLDLDRVLPFVEFLLKNVCVLEKMVISTRNIGDKHLCCESKELLKVARKLLNCPRSSRNAVVLFTE